MKQRVAVIGGGVSPEHEVSLVSAARVCEALSGRGYPLTTVWIDPTGAWHVVPDAAGPWSGASFRQRGSSAARVDALAGPAALTCAGVACVFPALHGRGGEDGQIQTLLDVAGLPYVGSGPTASAIGMSKLQSRLAFAGAGLPLPRAWLPERAGAATLSAAAVAAAIDAAGFVFPVFVKEDLCGSSLGVERVEQPAGFGKALARVRELGTYWLVEEGVVEIELTYAFLNNSAESLQALPPVEIRPRHAAFFDYAAKYDGSATEEICPAPSLDAALTAEVQSLAVRAHEVLGCRGFSRTDMMLGPTGVKILETNTLPGLTPESLLPRAAAAAGLEFADLIELSLALAAPSRTGQERAVLLPRPTPTGQATTFGKTQDRLIHGRTS